MSFAVAFCLIGGTGLLRAERFGPAADPDAHEDWGGTPDLRLGNELGLSAEELGEMLQALEEPDVNRRVGAALALKQNAVGSEQVIRDALFSERKVSNADIRIAVRQAEKNAKDGEGGMAGALLQMAPDGAGISAATRIAAMLVALNQLNTMAGYKVMLDFSGRHAGAFRSMIGELLVKQGLKALPALIYGRGSRDAELHMFAVKWIRDMGNPLLSEQLVGITDSRRLAQLLEAYASVNELNAIDVTLSCTNHDSLFVRRAARRCLEVYGKNARWSVFREYQNVFAEDPDPDEDVARWLERLYAVRDEAREAADVRLFETGSAHAKAGRFAQMADAWGQLLAGSPLHEERARMARGYLDWARQLESDGDADRASAMYRMALRLADNDSADYRSAHARLAFVRAEANRASGAVDVTLYRELSLVDDGPAMKRSLRNFLAGEGSGRRALLRVFLVSLFIFIAALLVYRRLKGSRDVETRAVSASPAEPPDDPRPEPGQQNGYANDDSNLR